MEQNSNNTENKEIKGSYKKIILRDLKYLKDIRELNFTEIPKYIKDKNYFNIENLLQQREEINEDDLATEVLFHKKNTKFDIKKNFHFHLNLRLDDWV